MRAEEPRTAALRLIAITQGAAGEVMAAPVGLGGMGGIRIPKLPADCRALNLRRPPLPDGSWVAAVALSIVMAPYQPFPSMGEPRELQPMQAMAELLIMPRLVCPVRKTKLLHKSRPLHSR